MILGLDVSTSITGYTILDYDGNVVACDHIDLRKEKNFGEINLLLKKEHYE